MEKTTYGYLSDLLWLTLVVLAAESCRRWLNKQGKEPTNWPVLGMLPALLVNFNRMYDSITDLMQFHDSSFYFYGPWFTGLSYFVTASPQNIEYALRDHFENFPKGEDFTAAFHDLLGKGIFNADHDLWRMQRKAASLQLNSKACRSYTDDTIFAMAGTKLVAVLSELAGRTTDIDLHDVLLRFTFDNMSIVGFGVDPGCLDASLPEVPFAKAFESALDCTTIRFLLPSSWWRVLKMLRLGKERSMKRDLAVVDNFVQGVIDARRRELREAAAKAAGDDRLVAGTLPMQQQRGDLVTCFMTLGEEDESLQDNDKFLKDVVINFLLAGRDTTALALSWFFWLVAKHPDVERKIVDEIRRVLVGSEGKLNLSRENLRRMTYLHAALSETLRLYPSVPVDIKQVLSEDTLPDGNHLKQGQKFVYCIYAMGRLESIWGPDCCEFKPERWLVSEKVTTVSPFEYVAFNAGPRTCLGKDMAYLQMKAAASAILHRFKISLLNLPKKPVVPKLSVTLYMKHGLHVTLQPRQLTTHEQFAADP